MSSSSSSFSYSVLVFCQYQPHYRQFLIPHVSLALLLQNRFCIGIMEQLGRARSKIRVSGASGRPPIVCSAHGQYAKRMHAEQALHVSLWVCCGGSERGDDEDWSYKQQV